MSIKNFRPTSLDGNGIPTQYNAEQCKYFFNDDKTIASLAETAKSIANGYGCELGEMQQYNDFLDVVQWYEEEAQREQLEKNNPKYELIKILKLAAFRAREIETLRK